MELESSAKALEWRVEKALNRELFHHSKHLQISKILKPGQCSVLQLESLDLRDQQMLLTILLRKINHQRIQYNKGKKSNLDFPVFILLEEGHRFTPANGNARSSGIIRTILSEGRKFGIGVGIISQRPSKIDDNVLSQAKTQIIMQIQNPNDQDAVRRSVEDVGEDLLSELPGLTPGQSIIAGEGVNTPFLCRIRERITQHGAENLKTTNLWLKKWREQNKEINEIIPPEDEKGIEDRESIL